MRKATCIASFFVSCDAISIPAFREEGDVMVILTPLAKSISIPAFREEGDYALCTDAVKVHIFQSPPSVRKATILVVKYGLFVIDFNPRLP